MEGGKRGWEVGKVACMYAHTHTHTPHTILSRAFEVICSHSHRYLGLQNGNKQNAISKKIGTK